MVNKSFFSSRSERKPFGAGASQFRLALVLLVQCAVAWLFYSLVWSEAPVSVPDSGSYLRAAQDLSDFHLDELQERAPGYPLLLLLTGSQRTLFFVSLFLHCASVSMLAYGLFQAGLKAWTISIFSLILFLPPYVEPAAYILSEVLAEVLLVAAVIGFYLWYLRNQAGWVLLSSIAIGCAALTRPAYQLLPIAVVGYLIIVRILLPTAHLTWKKVGTGSLILVTGSVLIVGGYAFYNLKTFGHFTVTPKFGLSLSLKTVRVVERLPDEYAAIRELLVKARNEELLHDPTHRGSMYIWAAVPALSQLTGLTPAELSGYMLRLNLRLIRDAPLTYLQEVVWAFAYYWFPASGELANFGSRTLQSIWAITQFCVMAALGTNLILFVGAVSLVIFSMPCAGHIRVRFDEIFDPRSGQGLMYGLVGTIIAYTALISCLFEVGDPRYRVSTDTLILFMVFIGWREWFGLISGRIRLCSNS